MALRANHFAQLVDNPCYHTEFFAMKK
ncbi:hypothetical protein H3S79_10090 [Bartonella sp. M0176]|nr:hypothetical protein [Bartonella sp. P0291]MBH9997850.1 hypothetical protein [Bartonella sp. M0192]MBI0000009.1 hypothetical protein [Bartonella sp. M0191]MBI0007572.1 hypothetical protein [Bartonella sp. M0193]MBI0011300.1 hypothetical protein [Bartonella sp. M0176]MBI0011578.1 hypothetical protein [Bartonella apihabitans]